jgi:signal transduction histidine kinase
MEPSDIRELVTSAVNQIAVSAESRSVGIVQIVPEGLAIALDRRRISRVLVNLLMNALEAMPRGGTIHISAVCDRGSILIEVRDTGPGIAPEIRDRLFEPFTTVGKANGIGLGLALSRQTVMDHSGEIWAESSGRGASFTVRLPGTISEPRAVSS